MLNGGHDGNHAQICILFAFISGGSFDFFFAQMKKKKDQKKKTKQEKKQHKKESEKRGRCSTKTPVYEVISPM